MHRPAGVSCTYPVQPGKQESEQETEQEIGAAARGGSFLFYTCKDVEDVALTGLAAVMAWVSGFERQRLIEASTPVRSGRAARQALGRPARPSCSCGWLRSWWSPLPGRSGGAGEGRQPRVALPLLSERPRLRSVGKGPWLSRPDRLARRVSVDIRF